MKRIAEIIKKENYRHVYLLYGEEQYLVRQAREQLKRALAGEDTQNLHVYTDKNINIGEVIDMAETLPFFAERRVFVIERSGLVKSGGEELAEYLKNPCETSYFIIAEQEVDKRSKLYKTITSEGMALEFAKQNEQQTKLFIASYLKNNGFNIKESTADEILRGTGVSMGIVKNELDKLIAYCDGRNEVTSEDVKALRNPFAEDKIFDMLEAIANKKREKALTLYYDLLMLHEAPMKILKLLARQIDLTLQAKLLKEKKYSNGDIAKCLSIPPYFVGKYTGASGGIDRQGYMDALSACCKAEEDIKTGRTDDRTAVEIVIMSILQ